MPYREYWHHDSWDEFHDDEIVDWKRLRLCIEHENALVNHRLTWLFASQAFLFTSFGVIWTAWKNPSGGNSIPSLTCQVFLMAVSCIGIIVCRAIQQSLFAAESHIVFLDRWWYLKGDAHPGGKYRTTRERGYVRNQRDRVHPPLQGEIHIEGNDPRRILSYTHLPNWFTVAWIFLIISIVFEGSFLYLAKSLADISFWSLFLSVSLLSIGLLVLFRKRVTPVITSRYPRSRNFIPRFNDWCSHNRGFIAGVLISATTLSPILGLREAWPGRLLLVLAYSMVLACVAKSHPITLDTEPRDTIVDVRIENDRLKICLRDGSNLDLPLAKYPRLADASDQERRDWRVEGDGYVLHWKGLDMLLCVENLVTNP
jgi:hypothetical protein